MRFMMDDKSYVSMEYKICPVCGRKHNYNCGILMDTRVKDTLDRETITGEGMCEEHQNMCDDGYIALIGIDPEKSELPEKEGKVDPSKVYRTGSIAHIHKDMFGSMFDVEHEGPIILVSEQVIKEIEKIAADITGNAGQDDGNSGKDNG
jgi:hypothetical protein